MCVHGGSHQGSRGTYDALIWNSEKGSHCRNRQKRVTRERDCLYYWKSQPGCYSRIFLYVYVLVTRSSMVSTCCPYRWSSQPAIFVFGAVHVPVKDVQLTVTEVIRVHKVKLSPCVMVTLIVPLSREIQPLWVSKLIPCEMKKQSFNTFYLDSI